MLLTMIIRERDNISSFKNAEMFEERADGCLVFLGVSPMVGPHGAGASPSDKKSKNKSMRGKKKSIFETYMSKEDVSKGLKRGTLIQVLTAYDRLFLQQSAVPSPCSYPALTCLGLMT